MYRSAVNYLQGNVSVRVESPFPERVLNLCAVHDVPFWDLKWLDAVTFTVSTTRRGLRRLRQVVGAECTVTVCRESGAPHFLRKFRRRYALWCGLAAFVLLLFGGIAYTVGSVLYGLGRTRKWMHSVFHIFVVLGSLLQFFAVLFYAL